MLTFFIASFTSIFAVVNPLSAMPIFIALTQGDTPERRNKQLNKACLYMLLILIIFYAAGTYIMSFFGISIQGIRIAGGLMIIQASLTLLAPQKGSNRSSNKISEEDVNAAIEEEDISFSPLAMPLLSGPGSIAVVLGLGSSSEYWTNYVLVIAAILVTTLATYLILRISPRAVRLLGNSGMLAMTRMMGFIGMAIGVQFIINGVKPLLKL